MNPVYFPRIKAGRGEKPETELKGITIPKSASQAISAVCEASFGGNFALYIRSLMVEDLKKRGYTVTETLST